MIPFAGFEVLETLVVLELFPQNIIHCILDLVFELELILFSHLHFYSLGPFVFLVPEDLLFIERIHLVLLIFKVIIIFFLVKFLFLFLLSLELESFQSR